MIRTVFGIDPTRYIIQALIWATGWFVILWVEEYPTSEWVGVVIAGYLSWYISHLIVFNAARFALRRIFEYAVELYGEQNEHAEASRRTHKAATLLVVMFTYGLGLTTSGLMFILTLTSLNAIGFPPFDISLMTVGLMSLGIGFTIVLSMMISAVSVLTLAKNSSTIRERVSRVRGVVWSALIARRDIILQLVFGLNMQNIARPVI